MTLTMFLILAAYYMLKTAREVFILSEGGAEVKSYSSAGQALLLLILVPAYGAFASARQPRAARALGHAVLRRRNLVLFLLALSAGLAHRHRLLPVGRDLQRDGDRAVLGVRQPTSTPRSKASACFRSSAWAAASARGSDRCAPAICLKRVGTRRAS